MQKKEARGAVLNITHSGYYKRYFVQSDGRARIVSGGS